MLRPLPTIPCVDCLGTAYLMTYPPEDGVWEAEDRVQYRCKDCWEPFDMVVADALDGDSDDIRPD